MPEVVIISDRGLRVRVTSSQNWLSNLHGSLELFKVDYLISIDIQSANHSYDFCLRCSITVHSAEIEDVVVIEEALAPRVHGVESLDIGPIPQPLQVILHNLNSSVVLDLFLQQVGHLFLDCKLESLIGATFIVRPLSYN